MELSRHVAGIPGGVIATLDFDPQRAVDLDALAPAEAALANALPAMRQQTFAAGRIALRAAAGAVLGDDDALANVELIRNQRGAPQLPVGVVGSISHKHTRAIALAAPSAVGHVGIDIERRPEVDRPLREPEGRRALAQRILVPAEWDAIAALDDIAHRQATLLHFALKEAVYKAIDPWAQRYVRFTEVALTFDDAAMLGDRASHLAGTAHVHLGLHEFTLRDVAMHANWTLTDSWIIASASARVSD